MLEKVQVRIVTISHSQLNDVAMWIEKDNVRVWLNKDMPVENALITNGNLTYDQSGADTYTIDTTTNTIESG
jgi:hypothetical protein